MTIVLVGAVGVVAVPILAVSTAIWMTWDNSRRGRGEFRRWKAQERDLRSLSLRKGQGAPQAHPPDAEGTGRPMDVDLGPFG